MIAIILGTLSKIIKISPIVRVCEALGEDYFTLHIGQHYFYKMDKAFLEDLDLPQPEYNLDVGSGIYAEQTGRIMMGIEKILLEEKPKVVIIQGNTNMVLAGALVASKLYIKVGDMEAGLRSFDRRMPEEINRVVADHISDILFPLTEIAKENLIGEGIHWERILVTGNTVMDAVEQNLAIAQRKGDLFQKLGLTSKAFFLVTAHRTENVNNRERLGGILQGLKTIQNEFSMPVHIPDATPNSKDGPDFRPLHGWYLRNKITWLPRFPTTRVKCSFLVDRFWGSAGGILHS